jgi:hypothetical protein
LTILLLLGKLVLDIQFCFVDQGLLLQVEIVLCLQVVKNGTSRQVRRGSQKKNLA